MRPRLSIVVVFYDMAREAPRTLHALSPDYQRGVAATDYEIIAIDNGSPEALTVDLPSNARLVRHEPDAPSPAAAINRGVEVARGAWVAVVVDGARMATPGLVRATLDTLKDEDDVVGALAWHLGPDVQNRSQMRGYDQNVEDRLLAATQWEADGYRLFGISTLAQSSAMGLGGGFPKECSWLALSRHVFRDIGGYDERFRSPGGGLVNHEFVSRLFHSTKPHTHILMGEGTFHQYHGGVATNASEADHPWPKFATEYRTIFDKDFILVDYDVDDYVGAVHPLAARFVLGPLDDVDFRV